MKFTYTLLAFAITISLTACSPASQDTAAETHSDAKTQNTAIDHQSAAPAETVITSLAKPLRPVISVGDIRANPQRYLPVFGYEIMEMMLDTQSIAPVAGNDSLKQGELWQVGISQADNESPEAFSRRVFDCTNWSYGSVEEVTLDSTGNVTGQEALHIISHHQVQTEHWGNVHLAQADPNDSNDETANLMLNFVCHGQKHSYYDAHQEN